MQTQQAPAVPVAPQAAQAPAAPATTSQTIVIGPDGKPQTITLSGGPPVLAGTETAPPQPRGSDQFSQGMAAGVALSLVVFTVLRFYRRYKRRGMTPAAQTSSESPERLERMERGIEAIAIEVERISEGQRFVTNLISESRQPAIATQSK